MVEYSEHTELREEDPFFPSNKTSQSMWKSKQLIFNAIILLWTMVISTIVLRTWILASNKADCQKHSLLSSQHLYSPVEHILKDEVTKFSAASGSDLSIYHGYPTPENDAAWKDLYHHGAQKIPKSQASLLPNETIDWPKDEENSMILLDVFHQLHCLDMLREWVYPEYYGEQSNRLKHVQHCIEMIRQSLMCSSDVSPIVWQWDGSTQSLEPRADIVHTCRNFADIHEWAKKRSFNCCSP